MKSRIATAFLCILFGPFGVFSLAWVFIAFARADYLAALVALGFAVFALCLAAMLAIVATGRVSLRIAVEGAGTTFRPDAKVDCLLAAATIGVFVSMATYAIFAPLHMVSIPLPRGDQRYYVFACAAGALGALPSLWQIIRQRGTSCLRMTIEAIVMGNAVSTRSRAWDDVTGVADKPRSGRQPSGTTYVATTDGQFRTLASDWYTPGGHALRELVRFYWQHPQDRGELLDGRAAERLGTES